MHDFSVMFVSKIFCVFELQSCPESHYGVCDYVSLKLDSKRYAC